MILPVIVPAADGDIDELSNHTLDLIQAGRFMEAERLCREQAETYPDTIDSLAQLREAQGRRAEAAKIFGKAAAFADSHPVRIPGLGLRGNARAEPRCPLPPPLW